MHIDKQKRYWVFSHPEHEAQGGMYDFQHAYEILSDAIYLALRELEDGFRKEAHIYDFQTDTIFTVDEAQELQVNIQKAENQAFHKLVSDILPKTIFHIDYSYPQPLVCIETTIDPTIEQMGHLFYHGFAVQINAAKKENK